MTARIIGRELARMLKSHPTNKTMEIDIMEWATNTSPVVKKPAVYELLNDLTKLNMNKALRYVKTSPSPSSQAESSSTLAASLLSSTTDSTSSAASTSASTSAISNGNNSIQLTLQRFDELARDSFLRTSAISKVPLWDVDLQKYEDLLLHASESKASTPVTLPGQGRKLWAGQEDLNKRYDGWDSLLTTTPSTSSAWRTRKGRALEQEAEEQEWEDEEGQSATPQLIAAQQKEQRDKYLKKKLRHPEGRNGNHGQRSAIARSKGHTAPPRTLRERFLRLDMPVTSRG